MDLNNLSYFKAITTRMHWLTARQKVLAENVANSDTPNYRAKDLSQPDFSQFLKKSGASASANSPANHINAGSLYRTHVNHLGGGSGNVSSEVNGKAKGQTADAKYEATPTENSVILEEEMIKLTKTAGDYAMMTNVYKKGVGMLKMAITKGR